METGKPRGTREPRSTKGSQAAFLTKSWQAPADITSWITSWRNRMPACPPTEAGAGTGGDIQKAGGEGLQASPHGPGEGAPPCRLGRWVPTLHRHGKAILGCTPQLWNIPTSLGKPQGHIPKDASGSVPPEVSSWPPSPVGEVMTPLLDVCWTLEASAPATWPQHFTACRAPSFLRLLHTCALPPVLSAPHLLPLRSPPPPLLFPTRLCPTRPPRPRPSPYLMMIISHQIAAESPALLPRPSSQNSPDEVAPLPWPCPARSTPPGPHVQPSVPSLDSPAA